jgi:hypothetical protein
VRKIYGPTKEEESWKIRMYKEINDIQGVSKRALQL